jgi:hypothetical protein
MAEDGITPYPSACELAGRRSNLLWIVPVAEVPAFRVSMRACGHSVKSLGRPVRSVEAFELP